MAHAHANACTWDADLLHSFIHTFPAMVTIGKATECVDPDYDPFAPATKAAPGDADDSAQHVAGPAGADVGDEKPPWADQRKRQKKHPMDDAGTVAATPAPSMAPEMATSAHTAAATMVSGAPTLAPAMAVPSVPPPGMAVGAPMQPMMCAGLAPMQQVGMAPMQQGYGMPMNNPSIGMHPVAAAGMFPPPAHCAMGAHGQAPMHPVFQRLQCPRMAANSGCVSPKVNTMQASHEVPPQPGVPKNAQVQRAAPPKPKLIPLQKRPSQVEFPLTSKSAVGTTGPVELDTNAGDDEKGHYTDSGKASFHGKRKYDDQNNTWHEHRWKGDHWHDGAWQDYGYANNTWQDQWSKDNEWQSDDGWSYDKPDKSWVDNSYGNWNQEESKKGQDQKLRSPYLPKGWEMKCAVFTNSYLQKDWSKCDSLVYKLLVF